MQAQLYLVFYKRFKSGKNFHATRFYSGFTCIIKLLLIAGK